VERGLELPTCAKSVPATYDGQPHNGRTSPFENLCFSYATASVGGNPWWSVPARSDRKRRIRDFPT